MLQITIPKSEAYDSNLNRFVYTDEKELSLEHSLVSISKWEAKWQKPFLGKNEKEPLELLDYIRCMTITQNVNPDIYNFLTPENIEDIVHYIESPMSATTFRNDIPGGGPREVITSELIYYWMIAYNVPMECQKWHLNRLLTLIRICSIKNQPPKKMSRNEIMNRNRALNEARRAKYNTTG